MRRWTAVLVLILVGVIAFTGTSKEHVMGIGWETYGAPLGISQTEWDNLPQNVKDAIKAGNPAFTSMYANRANAAMAVAPSAPAEEPMGYADTGGGDTGGGGGGSYAALEPPKLLAESPEWLAYLNALGLEEQQYRADIDKTRALYQSDAERQKGDLTPVYNQSRRGIAGGLEARGMSRSGELLRKLAENRQQEGRQRAGIDATLAGQTSGLESQLANKLMDLNARKAQQELQLKSQGYI